MGADPADQPRSGLEERELVAGKDDSVGSDDFARYVLLHRHGGSGGGLPEIKRRRLEFVVDGGALPSPTPSSEHDSHGTISDVDVDAGADPLAQGLPFPCPVCRREFASQKAVCGHMRTHDPRERRQGEKERQALVTVAIGLGWAVTRKRGSVGGRSGSPESEGVVDSMATVVSEHVVDAMPIAFASRSSSSSAEPNPPPSDGSTGILDASSDSPTSQAIVRPPCSRQFLEGHQPSAPQPAVAQAQHFAEVAAAASQFVVRQRAAPQVVGHHVQPSSPPQPTARDAQGWWLCKEKGCDHRFATHQGLGGHMAAHKIRQNNEAAAAGLHLGVGDPRPAKLFPCKMCPSVFTSGVQLGGHMRKHYPGKVTPKKKRVPRPKVSARELASALSLSLPLPPVAMEVAQAQPAASPGVPGAVRIFGVNIVPPGIPASTAEEASSDATETDPSSAASTDIEQ